MLPSTAVVIMLPIIIPFTTATNTLTFSERFSTVGLPAGTAVVTLTLTPLPVLAVVVVVEVALAPLPEDTTPEGSTTLTGKLVVTAAMTLSIFSTTTNAWDATTVVVVFIAVGDVVKVGVGVFGFDPRLDHANRCNRVSDIQESDDFSFNVERDLNVVLH